jgi:hypothetical protein
MQSALSYGVRMLYQRSQVFVFDALLAIGNGKKLAVCAMQRFAIERVPERPEPGVEGVTSRVLAQNQTGFRRPDCSRRHDFVGNGRLEYTVLMDPGFVCESVLPNDVFDVDKSARCPDGLSRVAGPVPFRLLRVVVAATKPQAWGRRREVE